MFYKNTTMHYGIIAMLLHWLMAVLIIALFILGQYMVELDYYDSWYQLAPWWHKSFGFIVFILLVIRIAWRLLFWIDVKTIPEPLISQYLGKIWAIKIVEIVHASFYLLLFTKVSGFILNPI